MVLGWLLVGYAMGGGFDDGHRIGCKCPECKEMREYQLEEEEYLIECEKVRAQQEEREEKDTALRAERRKQLKKEGKWFRSLWV